MRKYVIIGVQGSGKGTQSRLLARDFDLVHISVGDIFRWHVRNHTKLGTRVRDVIAAGGLVDDDTTERVVRERLDEHDWNHGFIVDGFPRDRRQAGFFLQSYDVDAVIHLHLPDDEVRRRVLSRRVCSRCGTEWDRTAADPEPGARCPKCGGELNPRMDDTEEALATRLRLYRQNIEDVLELFRRKERVITVDARPDIETVQREIRRRLGLVRPRTP
jgi:adenylate kinase